MRLGVHLGLGIVCLGLLACGGSSTVRLRESGDDCPPAKPAIPMRSFGQEAEPFKIERFTPVDEHDPSAKRRSYVYRFEREPSGTIETLRGVFMEHQGRVIAVGHRGTALVRDPAKGWTREATGTEENLHAITRAPFRPEGPVDAEREKHAPYIAVGAHGTALVRSEAGVWRAEQTGTDKDLFAVWHGGTTTWAVGAGGTMVQRSPEGVWRPVKTRTTADLYGIHGGNVAGAGGLTLECRGFDKKEPVCIPRPVVVPRDLRAVSQDDYFLGDGALLAFMKGPDDKLTLQPVGGSVDFVPADDPMRAVWSNHWSEMGEKIAVGRAGVVWFLANPYYREKTFERVQLPFGADLYGVAFELVDGFLVGDKGTIVHLAVDGVTPPTICLE
ncbi:hypothetical protein [Polyangium aurulentum]|uniref:hypothetical protein n=1 Tax=Polyangium aurulentum TaxID=2567896 RepID=UPI0010AEA370|nr:hypothetical protein [Polyangium aurulentum]UQA59061.1 hypothetical protein E8A73_000630 [Polyangium aurulentum]